MTQPIQVIEPDRLTQGESVEWRRTICEYPATEWTLQYRFRGSGTGFNVNATADGTAFSATITTAETLAAGIGKYQWQAWVTNIADTTVIRMVSEGVLIVERGFASGSTGSVEIRSTAKQILDAIDAALLTAAPGASTLEYEISTPAGTHRHRKSMTEAIALRDKYALIVSGENQAERVRNGKPFAATVVARMRR